MKHQAAISFILEKLEEELASHFTYHNLRHTLDVMEVCEQLCEAENVPPYEQVLLRTAAAYHDAGFLESPQNHEEAGCRMVQRYLPIFGYSDNAIERICDIILATKIPQTPHNLLEEILCDADLDYLGRIDFLEIGQGLFMELKTRGMLQTEQEWNLLQLQFLSEHKYFTTTNQQRREPLKQVHLSQLRSVVDNYHLKE